MTPPEKLWVVSIPWADGRLSAHFTDSISRLAFADGQSCFQQQPLTQRYKPVSRYKYARRSTNSAPLLSQSAADIAPRGFRKPVPSFPVNACQCFQLYWCPLTFRRNSSPVSHLCLKTVNNISRRRHCDRISHQIDPPFLSSIDMISPSQIVQSPSGIAATPGDTDDSHRCWIKTVCVPIHIRQPQILYYDCTTRW